LYNAVGKGAAVHSMQGTLRVSSSLFSRNTVPLMGGAAIFFGTGALSLLSSNFTDNSSGGLFSQGGAVQFQTVSWYETFVSVPGPPFTAWNFMVASSLTVAGCLFNNNVAESTTDQSVANTFESFLPIPYGTDVRSNAGSGGAIFVKLDYYSNVSVVITDSLFSNNVASAGGAISMLPSQTIPGRLGTPSLNISGCVFSSNTAYLSGGALALGASTSSVLPAFAVSISDSVFSNNVSPVGSGGAISMRSSGTVTISNSSFRANWASTGGTFSINATAPVQLTMSNCTVSDSHAQFGAFAAILGGSRVAVQLNAVTVLNQNAAVGALYYTAPGVRVSSTYPPTPPAPIPPAPRAPNFPSGTPAGSFDFRAQGNSSGFISPLDNQFYTLDTGKALIEQLTGETVFITLTQIGFSTTYLVQVNVATPPPPPFPPRPPPRPPAPPVFFPPSFIAGVTYSTSPRLDMVRCLAHCL
jgi:predicted outer membrane repeat protein